MPGGRPTPGVVGRRRGSCQPRSVGTWPLELEESGSNVATSVPAIGTPAPETVPAAVPVRAPRLEELEPVAGAEPEAVPVRAPSVAAVVPVAGAEPEAVPVRAPNVEELVPFAGAEPEAVPVRAPNVEELEPVAGAEPAAVPVRAPNVAESVPVTEPPGVVTVPVAEPVSAPSVLEVVPVIGERRAPSFVPWSTTVDAAGFANTVIAANATAASGDGLERRTIVEGEASPASTTTENAGSLMRP
jgi:hypothetical protein